VLEEARRVQAEDRGFRREINHERGSEKGGGEA